VAGASQGRAADAWTERLDGLAAVAGAAVATPAP
jgi:hypothetical protein